MKVCRVGVATPTQQTASAADMLASTLPEELVEEILLGVPPDEPAHLVRATVVCKSWHSILSDDTFRRRYHRFHGTPPLLGYICYQHNDSTVQFVPTTSVAAASTVCAPNKFHGSSSGQKQASPLDCHHGRVLIETGYFSVPVENMRFIVWDPIAGTKQNVSLPTYPQFPSWCDYTADVLCAKDGCDHHDCHGGPFLIVLLVTSFENGYEAGVRTWASVYSSETGAWSSPTTPNDETNKHIDDRPGLLIGDALYFTTTWGANNIVKYDLRKHELSVMMHLPAASNNSIVIKGNDGGLGVAAMLGNCIHMWSWQIDNNGVGGWVEYRVMELDDTLLPKVEYPPYLICMVDGTNTCFIDLENTGVFMLDLNSRKVSKIGETETYSCPIIPFMSFSTPKY